MNLLGNNPYTKAIILSNIIFEFHLKFSSLIEMFSFDLLTVVYFMKRMSVMLESMRTLIIGVTFHRLIDNNEWFHFNTMVLL